MSEPSESHSSSSSQDKEVFKLGSDLFKKVMTLGAGAAVMTEEVLKAFLQDVKLPKELMTNLLTSAQSTKNEFVQRLSTEIVQTLKEKTDLKELVSEILRKNEFEITIKVKTAPKNNRSSTESTP